jgi:hypothetical protein
MIDDVLLESPSGRLALCRVAVAVDLQAPA